MTKYSRFKIERLMMNFSSHKLVLENPKDYLYDEKQAKAMRKNMESIREALKLRVIEINNLIAE